MKLFSLGHPANVIRTGVHVYHTPNGILNSIVGLHSEALLKAINVSLLGHVERGHREAEGMQDGAPADCKPRPCPSLPHPWGSSVGLPCTMFRSLTWPSWLSPPAEDGLLLRLGCHPVLCLPVLCQVSPGGCGQRGSCPELLPWLSHVSAGLSWVGVPGTEGIWLLLVALGFWETVGSVGSGKDSGFSKPPPLWARG